MNARPATAESGGRPGQLSSAGNAVSLSGTISNNSEMAPFSSGTKDSRSTWGGEKKLKFTFKEQKEFETIDDDIAALEEKIAVLEQQMTTFARDFGKLNQILQEKEAAETALEEKMDRWMYLTELKEKIDAQNH
jgi:ATP-binding cassette subfamily F protein uup